MAIAVIAAVFIIAAGIGVGIWWKADQNAKAAAQALWEQTHTSHLTKVETELPGFDDGSTAIPVKVAGTDLDGNAVDETQYLHPGSMYVETLQGSYDFTFTGGYFTSGGKVVKAPDEKRHVEIWDTSGESTQQANKSNDSGAQAGSGSSEGADAQAESENSKGASTQAEPTEPGEASIQTGSEEPPEDASTQAEPAESDDASTPPQSSGSGEADGGTAQPEQDQNTDPDSTVEIDLSQGEGAVEVDSYIEVPDLEVTDELIASITSLAEQDPDDNGKTAQLSELASQNHTEAIAAEQERIRAEEERARAEEEAARLAAEKAAREAIPNGGYSYVAPAGGYRGFIDINGTSAKLTQASAFRPDRFEYYFTLEKTSNTAPNGNAIYRLVPVGGNPYAGGDTLYYDAAQGGIIYETMLYVGPA